MSQLPLIPSVLLAEAETEAELERAAAAVFESFKMQRQARAAAQRSSHARGCASRLAGGRTVRASRSASIGFLYFGGFSLTAFGQLAALLCSTQPSW